MDLRKAVRIIFVLSSALSAAAAVSRPWWSTFAQRAYCSSPGEVICNRDCSEVQICLGNLEDDYDPQTMIVCDKANGMWCSASQRQCVPKEESDCVPAGNTFTCNSIGSFPDPYDCKTYHVCIEGQEQAVTGTCNATDAAYNPCTGDCTLTTSDRVCTEGPVKPCTQSLEMGIVPENPNIYYACKPTEDGGYYPDMYKCPGGYVFDTAQFTCVASSEICSATRQ
ncbi:uncharacterized protein LOC126482067 [Schistocerca serialis cubense]|uniref:uncharacterized protein LOC126482067 n=1 Tax=Schistocerca serialis cubense TaxID=2023355 RepID=UPI00214E56F7|nr:uncharacterized protein LOC126482067 [Schistocerca serialis cubense]